MKPISTDVTLGIELCSIDSFFVINIYQNIEETAGGFIKYQ